MTRYSDDIWLIPNFCVQLSQHSGDIIVKKGTCFKNEDNEGKMLHMLLIKFMWNGKTYIINNFN